MLIECPLCGQPGKCCALESSESIRDRHIYQSFLGDLVRWEVCVKVVGNHREGAQTPAQKGQKITESQKLSKNEMVN